jgi:hypothetical protein
LKVLAWRNKCITRVELVEDADINTGQIVNVLPVNKKDIEKVEDILKVGMYMIKNQEIMKRMLRWSYRVVKNPAVELVKAQNVTERGQINFKGTLICIDPVN